MTAETDIPFQLFGTPHVVVMITTIALPAMLSILVRVRPRTLLPVCIAVSAILIVNDLIFRVYSFREYGVEKFHSDDLPLHMCAVSIYLIPIMLLARNRYIYEIIWFWGIAGTAQAIITPDLSHGFPSFVFFRFFVAHAGIVAAALLATWGLKMRPGKGAVLRVLIVSNIFAILVAVLNYIIPDANYMFLCEPPEGESPMFFLPWPWYILFLEVVALVGFTALYLPFVIGRRLRRNKTPNQSEA